MKTFDYHLNKGIGCLRKKEYEKALEHLSESIKINPRSAEAFFYMGCIHKDLQNHNEAIEWFKKGTTLDASDTAFWHALGDCYFYLKDYPEAIRCYKNCIDLDNSQYTAMYNLGACYYLVNSNLEAIRCFERSIELDSSEADPWNGLGNVYTNLKNYPKAISCYEQCIELNKSVAAPWLGLGIVYYDLKNFAKAISCYEKSIELDKSNTIIWIRLGLAYSDLKNYREAIKCLERCIALDNSDATPWHSLGNKYFLLLNYPEAIKCYSRAISLDPNLDIAWLSLGVLYLDGLHNPLEASGYFNRYLYLNDHSLPLNGVSNLLQFSRNYAQSPGFIKEIFRHIELDSAFSTYLDLLIFCHQNTEPFDNIMIILKATGNNTKEVTEYIYTQALLDYFMGFPPAAYRIYYQNFYLSNEHLSLYGLYYFIKSAQSLHEPFEDIIIIGLKKAEEQRVQINKPDLSELYYAGMIYLLNEQVNEAYECFELSSTYLPSKYMMQNLLSALGRECEREALIKEIIHDEINDPENGFINGFGQKSIVLEGEAFFSQFKQFALHDELSEVIAEIRDYMEEAYENRIEFVTEEYELPDFWDAFYLTPTDEQVVNTKVLEYRKSELLEKLLDKWVSKINAKLSNIPESRYEEENRKYRVKSAKLYDLIKKIDSTTEDKTETEEYIFGTIVDWDFDIESYYYLVLYALYKEKISPHSSMYLFFLAFTLGERNNEFVFGSRAADIASQLAFSFMGALLSGPLGVPLWLGSTAPVIFSLLTKYISSQILDSNKSVDLDINSFKAGFKNYCYELSEMDEDKLIKDFPLEEFFEQNQSDNN